MESNSNSQSAARVLREYFEKRSPVETLAEFKAELAQLSPEEKDALAEGIRTGTFTY